MNGKCSVCFKPQFTSLMRNYVTCLLYFKNADKTQLRKIAIVGNLINALNITDCSIIVWNFKYLTFFSNTYFERRQKSAYDFVLERDKGTYCNPIIKFSLLAS